MRWWHFWLAAASIGLGLLAFAVEVAAQKSTKPKRAAPKAESADTLDAEVMRLYEAGKYVNAISLARRALAVREKALGPDHPDVGIRLNNLAAAVPGAGAAMPRPSRSSSAHLESARRRWGPTTPMSASGSTTWPGYTGRRAATPRPSRP